MSLSDIDPPKNVKPESLIRKYELHGISIKGLTLFVFFFLLTAAVLHADIWVLLTYLSSRPRPQDQPNSVASSLSSPPYPPLQPTPAHMNVAFEDLVQLRQKEQEEFRKSGWRIDPRAGEAEIPDRIIRQLEASRHGGLSAPFPPTMAPMRAGEAKPRAQWGPFPPVAPPPDVMTGGIQVPLKNRQSAGPSGAYVPLHRQSATSQPKENSSR